VISIKWILPGTVLAADTTQDDAADRIFTPMFLTGGLVLSQVAQITGLESYTIQNWVKRGFLAPPQNKKYTRRQLSRIILINMLKSAIPMEQICRLLSYVNGQLDDESDDIIDDSHLYQYFLLLAARAKAGELHSAENRETLLAELMTRYTAPSPQAAERVAAVLRIMLIAWTASCLQQEANALLSQLPLSGEASISHSRKE